MRSQQGMWMLRHLGWLQAQAWSYSCLCLPQDEFMPVYAAHLRGIIKRGVDDQEDYEHPLRGFHIVVDAGNGGGGYFAYDVLQPLGANIEGRQPWLAHP